MKRLIAALLLAGLMPATPARASDPNFLPGTVLPTMPQVPAPVLAQGGTIHQASAVSRVILPLRERVAASPVRGEVPPAPAMPLPTGFAAPQAGLYAGYAGGACATGDCATPCGRGACYDRFKAWLCFQRAPDSLPKFNPHPYVGPIAGTFPCTSAAGYGCATGGAAVDAGRCGHGGLFGAGCRGGCVPPADDAIPGYRFAGYQPPATASSFAPLGYTTHKPAAPAFGQPVQAAHVVQPRSPLGGLSAWLSGKPTGTGR
jgi:hypothetical protein